jgi:hypothetical protein
MVNPWRVVAVMALVCVAAPAYAEKPEVAVEAAIKSDFVQYQTAAQLVLGPIAIKDGGSWKWVSLQYATPMGVVQRSQK